MSIYDTSKVQKGLVETYSHIGKIGIDMTIFVRCAGAESGAYLGYVSIYDTSKVQKEFIETILPRMEGVHTP